jgi:hypothetical protein
MKPLKIASIGLGAVIGVAHIGILGHLVSRKQVVQPPAINFPSGRYSSYKVEVDKDGYTIEYKANDPKTLTSERSLDLVENKKGIFAVGDICSYPGKLKLILSGFHEGALAARACFKLARPNEKYRFEFTTSSSSILKRLGKKSD